MKTCKKCEKEKPKADFYASKGNLDGLFGKCKDCTKARVRANRKAKFDQYSQYEKRRNKAQPERRKALRDRAQNWRNKNPIAYKAQTAIGNALRDGRIQKEDCLFCGAHENIHAHHNDYNKPLDVIWLCAKCHHRVHANFPIHGHGEGARQ